MESLIYPGSKENLLLIISFTTQCQDELRNLYHTPLLLQKNLILKVPQKYHVPSLSSSSSEKGDVHIISSTLVVAREEVADIRGVIWLGLCAASSVTIHFPHPPLYYSLVHLVRPKMEELIS